MPRPNAPRSIAGEKALAARVAVEREARAMTYDGLAREMRLAGCPINASALYKIEKGDPPRRITVDELIALSRVFQIPLDDLILPPEVVANPRFLELIRAFNARFADARIEVGKCWRALVDLQAFYQ